MIENISDFLETFLLSLGVFAPILACFLIVFESILPVLPLCVFITINFYFFVFSAFLIYGKNTKMIAAASRIHAIGRANKAIALSYIVVAERSCFSAIPPRINPRTIGAVPYPSFVEK